MSRHITPARTTSPDSRPPRPAAATQTLPYIPQAIEEGIVTLPGPRYCAVLETGAVNLALLHPDELAGLTGAYHGFLAGLAFPVQLLVRVQPADPTSYLHWYAAQTAERAAADPGVRWLVTRHLAHVGSLVASTAPLAHRFYVIVPAAESGCDATATAGRFMNPLRRLLRRPHADDSATQTVSAPTHAQAIADALAQQCGAVASALHAASVPVRRLTDNELAALWQTCLCPQHAALQPLHHQTALGSVQPVATLEGPWPAQSVDAALRTGE
jgi:hypothetical protein